MKEGLPTIGAGRIEMECCLTLLVRRAFHGVAELTPPRDALHAIEYVFAIAIANLALVRLYLAFRSSSRRSE